MALKGGTPAIVLATCLAISLAGCGQAATSTTAPTASTATPTAAAAPTTAASEAPLPALDLLWEQGGTTEISGWYPGTYQPAVDPLTGDIWVALSSEHIIWIFSKDGEYKSSFGKPGDGPGEFDFRRPPCRECPGAGALAFAPDGSLFVADVGNHRVQKFDPEHEFETEWGGFGAGEGKFADAIHIAASDREVFVGDDAQAATQVFDMSGTFLRELRPGWLAVDPASNLSISGFGSVYRYDGDGNQLESVFLPAHGNAHHIGLAADDRGRLFFNLQDPVTTDAVGLGAFDPATGESRAWSTGGETLAIAGDVLYVANYTGPGWPTPVLRAYALPE